jgi:hypothetical protein
MPLLNASFGAVSTRDIPRPVLPWLWGGRIQGKMRIVERLEQEYTPDSIKRLDSMWLKFYIALDMIVAGIRVLILGRFTSLFRQEE